MTLYDCLIIGGGPAGLSSALGLCRALRPCVIFDDGSYRNANTNYMHTVPTWDHKEPSEWRASVVSEILNGRYSTVSQICTSPIVKISKISYNPTDEKSDHYFSLVDRNGACWLGKTVIFASGVSDFINDIPGFSDAWGQSIFHCLFCHGFEEKGAPSAGILVLSQSLWSFVHVFAGQTARLAKKITIYANGIQPGEGNQHILRLLAANGFHIEPRKIARLLTTKFKPPPGELEANGSLEQLPSIHIWFEGNSSEIPDTTETFLVTKPGLEVRNLDMMESIGVRMAPPYGFVDANISGFLSTSVPGVYAAGDITSPTQTVTNSIHQGTLVAGGVHQYLIDHDLNRGNFKKS